MLTTLSPSLPVHHAIIARANLAPSTRVQYIREINKLIASGIDPRNREQLAVYAQGLSTSSRSFLKASLRLLYEAQVTNLKASATGYNIGEVQAALYNIEAMTETIQVHKSNGSKTHTWLSREQVEAITAACDLSTIEGRRDWIVLGVLLGAGLRRDELSRLTFDALMQQPAKKGLRDVLSITGKGGRRRTIPISPRLAYHLRQWQKETGGGNVARSVNKSDKLGASLSAIGIHNIVRKAGARIELPELDSHDLRRTYARLGYDAGVPVEQISKLLGHADVRTTMLYLGIDIDIESSVSDFIPLSGD